MNCKDCFNCENCSIKFGVISQPINGIEEYDNFHNWDNVEELCKLFKDKSKIVELPCKVGDTVYRILSDCIREETVLRIRLDCTKNQNTLIISTEYLSYNSEYINEVIFVNKKEAEARLKELQNG